MEEFLTVGLFLWALVIVSFIMFFIGLWQTSWKALVWSGSALLPPMLAIFMGGAGIWFRLCILLPLAIFAAAYYMKEQKTLHL